jgi:hypothetical protein
MLRESFQELILRGLSRRKLQDGRDIGTMNTSEPVAIE